MHSGTYIRTNLRKTHTCRRPEHTRYIQIFNELVDRFFFGRNDDVNQESSVPRSAFVPVNWTERILILV